MGLDELWMDCESHLKKNPIHEIEKTVIIKVKLPHVNIRTISETANFFSNAISSLYIIIILL